MRRTLKKEGVLLVAVPGSAKILKTAMTFIATFGLRMTASIVTSPSSSLNTKLSGSNPTFSTRRWVEGWTMVRQSQHTQNDLCEASHATSMYGNGSTDHHTHTLHKTSVSRKQSCSVYIRGGKTGTIDRVVLWQTSWEGSGSQTCVHTELHTHKTISRSIWLVNQIFRLNLSL